MSAAAYSDVYARALKEIIIIRRYTGSATRLKFEAQCRGRATPYEATELVAGLQQGDQKVIVLVADLLRNGLTMPLTNFDKAVVAGVEISIQKPLARKAPDGSLIAYELQCRG